MATKLLADADIVGHIDRLAARMQRPPWDEFWLDSACELLHFADLGLARSASDRDVWQVCQAQELCLITNNRNRASDTSLEATIRALGTVVSLPVFTISSVGRLDNEAGYADRVIDKLFDYIHRLNAIRGTGRLFLP